MSRHISGGWRLALTAAVVLGTGAARVTAQDKAPASPWARVEPPAAAAKAVPPAHTRHAVARASAARVKTRAHEPRIQLAPTHAAAAAIVAPAATDHGTARVHLAWDATVWPNGHGADGRIHVTWDDPTR